MRKIQQMSAIPAQHFSLTRYHPGVLPVIFCKTFYYIGVISVFIFIRNGLFNAGYFPFF